MKRVLITGGNGFIGKQIIPYLLEKAFEVHVLSSRAPMPSNHIYFHQANLLDDHEHQNLINKIKPTHLIHSAWYTQNGKFWDAIDNVYWLKATISLAEAFFKAGGYRLLGLGTCGEYAWSNDICQEGKTAEIPATLYGKTKKSALECLQALAQTYSASFTWARIFFPYGEGEAKERLIPYVILNLLRGQEARCTHGKQLRDYMHVSDFGSALASLLNSEVNGVVNIASGNTITIQGIIKEIGVLLKREELIQFGAIPEPPNSPPALLADVDRLRNEVKWTPKISLNAGLLRTINWWETEITRM